MNVKMRQKVEREIVMATVDALLAAGFNISVEWSSASNGETCGTLRIYLVLRGESKVYSGWGYNCAGTFSEGLEIIKSEFKAVL